MAKQKTFTITTAIPYVNGKPHIGFAMEIIEADCLARYHRLLGEQVYFLTGTDEHGSKMVQTAKKLSLSPRQLADRNSSAYKKLMTALNITNDNFIRTSDQQAHWPGAQKLWKKLEAKGDLYKATYEGLYCVGCESFKLDKDLVDGLCPDHNKAPELVRDENWFFRLSKYTGRIAKLIESQKLHIIPEFRANEILALCDEGLQDVSFSRSRRQLKWGIPVPGDPDQVMYVWCDALSNYLTGMGYAKETATFKNFWPPTVQVLGKDILRFHAAIWIGMLLSADLPLPKSELIHGWIHVRGQKMSKSKGNMVDPFILSTHYGTDALRYWMLSDIPMGGDGDFTFQNFEEKINADLANNLGNLVNRVFVMTDKYLSSKVPMVKVTIPSKVKDAWRTYHGAMKTGLIHNACQSILNLVDFGNKFIDESKPWILYKEGQTKRLEKDMRILLKLVLHLAFMLEPICPGKAEQIAQSYGLQTKLNAKGLDLLESNTLLDKVKKIKRGELLFQRIDEERSLAGEDAVKLHIPQTPILISPEAKKQNLPVVSFTLLDLKPIGTNRQKKLKKEWEQWISQLRKRPPTEKKQIGSIIEKAYSLNESLGISRSETPGNALLQQYLADPQKEFPFVAPIVALYNFVEAKYGLSVGAHDIEHLKGDVQLKICDGSEEYSPLGETGLKKVPAGTYAYCDDEGHRVICWLEVKQVKETAITNKTTNALFLFQGYSGVTQSYVQKAADELKGLLEKWLK